MSACITCPFCQQPNQKKQNKIGNNYFTTTCNNCATVIHFIATENEAFLQAYFVNAFTNTHKYQLAFHVERSALGVSEANTFELTYLDEKESKWKAMLHLSFLPNINATNLHNKLKTILTFM